MSFMDFLKDRSLLFLLHLTCMGALAGFLRMTGYPEDDMFLILIFWCLILSGWLIVTFFQRRKYFYVIEQIMDKMEERYLLGELMPASFRLEDRLYANLIRFSNKSVIEKIRQLEQEQKDYREYIESWVHEVKAPITGIALLCENGRKGYGGLDGEHGERVTSARELFRNISVENQKIENYVDMALYYARSDQVYQDYMIRETDLQQVVYEVLEKNRLLLIQNGVRVEVSCGESVYTDRKWIGFILNQILLNSVKYKSENPVFCIEAERREKGVIFSVEDNGTGILPEDLSRIFEKGFTGSNGRARERSTGMGLYLCRKLCRKLGVGISAESWYGEGTKMMLEFPVSNYVVNSSK